MAHLKTSLSEADLDKARKELSEDPNTRRIEIQTLRERLGNVKGLKHREDDAFLIKFLRGRKWDQERAYELIKNYYEMKKENEDIFATCTPHHIRHVLDAEITSVLPGKSKQGELVVIFRIENWDPSKHPMEDIFKSNFLTNVHITDDEGVQVHGVRYIVDLKDFSMTHAVQMTPSMAKKMANMAQDAFPLRIKGIHYINESKFFDYAFEILKPFLNEKLKSRINFHGDRYEELLKVVDKCNLPKRYGGDLPDEDGKDFNKALYSKQKEFEAETKFGYVNMTLTTTQKKSKDATETMPGMFKKLNVD